MRQAGRSLPEYRAVRGDGSILDAIKRPELAAEITLQPVARYGVDAAVLYSDIVVPAHAVGFGVDVAPGTGPVVAEPLRARRDLDRLRPLGPDDVTYVADTVAAVVAQLDRDVPLLAFAGAPFTVASYLIEGRPSKTYEHTKALLHTDEGLWHDVMARLTDQAVAFIDVQLSAGGRAFQLFDSWAGALSRAEYERFVLPHSRRVFAELADRHPGVPGIHFGIGCDHLLEAMWAAGPQVIGLDWRTPIAAARRRLGPDVVVQGNLDPALVLAGTDVATAGARAVLADNAGHPGHVFNLGHGVLPASDPDVLAAVVELVHAWTTQAWTVGVILMAYGTPRAPEEIEPYYTDIRRGRPPTPEQLADLTRRYEAIGGLSPLARLTEAQRDELQAALDTRAPGTYVVRARAEARRPQGRGRRRRAGRPRRRAHRRPRARPALLVDVGRPVRRAGPIGGRRGAGSRSPPSRAGRRSRPTSRSSPPTCGDAWPAMPAGTKVVFTAHSLPGSRAGHRRSVPERAAGHGDGRRRRRRARPMVAVVDRLAVGRPDARAVDRPGHPGRHRRAGGGRARRRAAGLPVRLRRRPPRGAVRPRPRGPPAGRGRRAWPSIAPRR